MISSPARPSQGPPVTIGERGEMGADNLSSPAWRRNKTAKPQLDHLAINKIPSRSSSKRTRFSDGSPVSLLGREREGDVTARRIHPDLSVSSSTPTVSDKQERPSCRWLIGRVKSFTPGYVYFPVGVLCWAFKKSLFVYFPNSRSWYKVFSNDDQSDPRSFY